MDRSVRRVGVVAVATVVSATALAGTAAGHGGALAEGARETISIPLWLFLTTGGAAVGASFLLASFVTDRLLVERIDAWRRLLAVPGDRYLGWALSALGLLGLATVIGGGFVGPPEAIANLAVLLVWVGWWSGLAMVAYLVGNPWPALNPWSTITRAVPSLDLGYPERLGAWPAVAGLLGLVWVEVVSPLADDPQLLAIVALAYSIITIAGALVVGPARWFDRVDPVSQIFAAYGRVAPLDRTDEGLSLRVPGSGLSEPGLLEDWSAVAFVVALVWATTYDGLVATPLGEALVVPLVTAGVPPLIAYAVVLLAGFLAFLAAFWLAIRASRRLTDTYLGVETLALLFAPPLVAIAAGYHLAHYLSYFLNLAPALVVAATSPLSAPAAVPTLAIPGWFGGIALAAVLLGHLLAIWVAHTIAYDSFPSRRQAIRSQYPIVLVMVAYTMVSLWIVTTPPIDPVYI